MRPKFWFYPYSKASKSVWALVDVMPNSRIIKRQGSTYAYKRGDIIVNWGNYGLPAFGGPVLNSSAAVEIATSKMRTFDVLQAANVHIPEYTRDRATAQAWCRRHRVLGRDADRGSEGAGITVYEAGSEVGQHRFYVKYIPKAREFRVHVFGGQVIDVQEKLKKSGGKLAYVRNTANGYVFTRGGLTDNPPPPGVRELAISAVTALGLHFGGVDVGSHATLGAYVYEVNTAPGIEGTTVLKYKEALNALSSV